MNHAESAAAPAQSRVPRDLFDLFARHPWRTARMLLGRDLAPDFRERVMLAVTQVNDCGICAWYHAREALRAGVDSAAVRALLAGEWGDAPPRQHAALLYAQHWAHTQGDTDAAARAAFEAAYPPGEREAVVTAIRFINAMNRIMRRVERVLPRRPGGRAR